MVLTNCECATDRTEIRFFAAKIEYLLTLPVGFIERCIEVIWLMDGTTSPQAHAWGDVGNQGETEERLLIVR